MGRFEDIKRIVQQQKLEREKAAREREDAALAENLVGFSTKLRFGRALEVYNMQHAEVRSEVQVARGGPRRICLLDHSFQEVQGRKMWECEVCELRTMEVYYKRIGDYTGEKIRGHSIERKWCRTCVEREVRRKLGSDRSIKLKFQ